MFAGRLESDPAIERVVAVDQREPARPLSRTRQVRTDLRDPALAHVLDEEAIDTLVHLSTTAAPQAAGGRARMKEHNVLGTMHLMAAAQRTPTMRTVVLRSTTAVYGSDHRDPALFRETDEPRQPLTRGFGRDATEVEDEVRQLAQRREDVTVALLRFANVVGPNVDSSVLSLFGLPVVPTVFGFDPRLQFCHEQDALEALAWAIDGRLTGAVNVAGDGVLYLSQCIRLAGRIGVPVPAPFVSGVASAVRRSGRVDASGDQLRLLQYGRAVDTTELRTRFGLAPSYSSRAALEDALDHQRLHGWLDRRRVERIERQLQAFLVPDQGSRVRHER